MERPHLRDRLWARLVDPATRQELAPASEVASAELSADAYAWSTPAVKTGGDALLQMSLN
jgi:hypothetical protein